MALLRRGRGLWPGVGSPPPPLSDTPAVKNKRVTVQGPVKQRALQKRRMVVACALRQLACVSHALRHLSPPTQRGTANPPIHALEDSSLKRRTPTCTRKYQPASSLAPSTPYPSLLRLYPPLQTVRMWGPHSMAWLEMRPAAPFEHRWGTVGLRIGPSPPAAVPWIGFDSQHPQ